MGLLSLDFDLDGSHADAGNDGRAFSQARDPQGPFLVDAAGLDE